MTPTTIAVIVDDINGDPRHDLDIDDLAALIAFGLGYLHGACIREDVDPVGRLRVDVAAELFEPGQYSARFALELDEPVDR